MMETAGEYLDRLENDHDLLHLANQKITQLEADNAALQKDFDRWRNNSIYWKDAWDDVIKERDFANGTVKFQEKQLVAFQRQMKGLREALFQHREDLHQYSKRPCPTCRNSAKALGLTGLVPDSCSPAWEGVKERKLEQALESGGE